MSGVNVEAKVKGNVNEFYRQVEGGIGKLIGGARVDSAVIFNDTESPVTFYVYNYVDSVYWVSAQKCLVAPGTFGVVAASGAFFKIHPNDDKAQEFLVAPSKAYVYRGPGHVEPIAATN